MGPQGPFQSTGIAVIRRGLSRKLGRLAAALAGVPFLALLVLTALGLREAWLVMVGEIAGFGVLGGLVAAVVAGLLGLDLFGARGTVRREGDRLVIERGRRLEVPLAEIEAGLVIPTKDHARVELARKGGDVLSMRLADVGAAEALLREARVDVGNQRCQLQLADPAARVIVALAVLGIVGYCSIFALGILAAIVNGPVGVLTWVALALLTSITAVRATSLPMVTVGTDGIAFKKGFRETFVPFDELAEIRPAGLGLLIRYRDGRQRKITSAAGIGPDRFRALMLRVREAHAARAAAVRPELAGLDRNGRSVAEWRAALAELTRRGQGYRAAGLTVEDLDQVLASADVPAERRIAAAVALRAAEKDGARARIRIAAEQCAASHVRVALERVGEGGDEEAALAEAVAIEEAEARRVR